MHTITCQPDNNKKVNNWINIIQDCLFLPTCLLCDQPGFNSQDLCIHCKNTLPLNLSCCYRCGARFDTASDIPRICGICLKHPPQYDETVAPFQYRDAIRYLIYTLKYNQRIKNARLLGYLLAEHLKNVATLPDCIIPVPLHRKRYTERGFNQVTEIGKVIAKSLDIPLDLTSCIRNRNTIHQTELDSKQRRKNLRHAFSIVKPISYQHIAILDDVMTTGTTVNEMAKALKSAGARKVDVWVCARPVYFQNIS